MLNLVIKINAIIKFKNKAQKEMPSEWKTASRYCHTSESRTKRSIIKTEKHIKLWYLTDYESITTCLWTLFIIRKQ